MNKLNINTLFIGILVYLYLINKILSNHYDFVLICLMFLFIGYFYIKNNIFNLAIILILFDIIKNYYYKEKFENILKDNEKTEKEIDNLIEDKNNNMDEDQDKYNENIIEYDEDDKKEFKDKDKKNELMNNIAES